MSVNKHIEYFLKNEAEIKEVVGPILEQCIKQISLNLDDIRDAAKNDDPLKLEMTIGVIKKFQENMRGFVTSEKESTEIGEDVVTLEDVINMYCLARVYHRIYEPIGTESKADAVFGGLYDVIILRMVTAKSSTPSNISKLFKFVNTAHTSFPRFSDLVLSKQNFFVKQALKYADNETKFRRIWSIISPFFLNINVIMSDISDADVDKHTSDYARSILDSPSANKMTESAIEFIPNMPDGGLNNAESQLISLISLIYPMASDMIDRFAPGVKDLVAEGKKGETLNMSHLANLFSRM